MKKNQLTYLCCSFLSSLGDILLLFALPAGFGAYKDDLSYTVALFLIPALAIFISTFFNKKISNRISSSNRDYGRLLLIVALVELAIAVLSIIYFDHAFLTYLLLIFVFIYAFSKEGIPRLFYIVAIYRYFCTKDEYRKIAGIDYALKILAYFIGILSSAYLIKHNIWIYSLIFDSLTFIPISLFLLSPKHKLVQNDKEEKTGDNKVNDNFLKDIKVLVPLLSLGSCLFWPHIALLADYFSIRDVWSATYLMSFLIIPGMLAGFTVDKITNSIRPGNIIYYLPLVYILSGAVFVFYPSEITISFCILLNGFIVGVYMPVDHSIRNSLNSLGLINFNTFVTRRFSLAQAFSCTFVIIIYKSEYFESLLKIALLSVIIIWISYLFIRRKNA